MIKINDIPIPDRMTHEEAAELFMSTAVGRASGVTRDEFLALLRARHPTEESLSAFIVAAKAKLEAGMMPALGPYTLVDHGHAIRCNTCLHTSWNSHDVLHRYCGHCQRFHEDAPAPPTGDPT